MRLATIFLAAPWITGCASCRLTYLVDEADPGFEKAMAWTAAVALMPPAVAWDVGTLPSWSLAYWWHSTYERGTLCEILTRRAEIVGSPIGIGGKW